MCAHARAHPSPHLQSRSIAPPHVLYLSPAASPPTCSPAAGLEGRVPGYPALGKEILRPCRENLGAVGEKKLTRNRARAHKRRSRNASIAPACSPVSLRMGAAQSDLIPPAAQPDATIPHAANP